ncbi:MAG TPA: hypothetical protein VE864_09420 [Streptosporangiaceae bacterium]|nr:hypothetical protein [Streptosporangiaceae bacterium]
MGDAPVTDREQDQRNRSAANPRSPRLIRCPGTPPRTEVAHATLFLTSDENSFVTDVTLTVDGGMSI